MPATEPPDLDIVKWYTRARKFPQLIGRTPDGAKIPGGPYTFTQVIGAGVILFLGSKTMSRWAHYGLIENFLILAAIAYGSVLLLGRIPLGARSPLAVGSGLAHALFASRTGQMGGKSVRPVRTHHVRTRVVMFSTPPPTPVAVTTLAAAIPGTVPPQRLPHRPPRMHHHTPAPAPAPAPVAAPAPAPTAMTGVQLLLARTPPSPKGP